MRTARQISAQVKALKNDVGVVGVSDGIILMQPKAIKTGPLFIAQPKDNIIIKFSPENIKGEYLVINSNGYTEAQFNTVIPEYDYDCIELYGKNLFQEDTRIPVNYGLGKHRYVLLSRLIN